MDLDFKFTADGLIPAIVQEAVPGAELPNGVAGDRPPTGRVLMFAWLNREALEKSMETGQMHYWSRSRGKLWLKGETSGHTPKIGRWFHDYHRDGLLFEVEQVG